KSTNESFTKRNRHRRSEVESRFFERRLHRFRYRLISFRAFILQRNVFDGDCARIRIEIRQDFIFRNPAAINLVRKDELSSLIIELQNNIFAEIPQRNLRAASGSQAPDFVRPILEFWIMRDAALQHDRREFSEPWRFATAVGIASFAMVMTSVAAARLLC